MTGGVEVTEGFGLIEAWRIVRRTRAGRMVSVSVTLSDWLYRAILAKSVLTLSRDYFRLRRPLERRIYELARKHCGRQERWRVSLEVLSRKAGSQSPRRVFRAMLREIVAADTLPDYRLEEAPGDILLVTPRAGLIEGPEAAPLSAETIEAARALVPGADVYALEAEWRAFWVASGRPWLRSADRAFLGWVAAKAAALADAAGLPVVAPSARGAKPARSLGGLPPDAASGRRSPAKRHPAGAGHVRSSCGSCGGIGIFSPDRRISSALSGGREPAGCPAAVAPLPPKSLTGTETSSARRFEGAAFTGSGRSGGLPPLDGLRRNRAARPVEVCPAQDSGPARAERARAEEHEDRWRQKT